MINITRKEILTWQRWLDSPFYWVKDCVLTIDESRAALGLDSVRPFPITEEYLRLSWYLADTFPVTFWNKSRRMLMSWLFCIRLLYKALFIQNTANYIICYKFDDADYMLEYRIKAVYDNVPDEYKHMLPKLEYKQGLIEIPENRSFIQAVSAGADQLRSRTASFILWDEVAKQTRIMDSWASIQPTIRGGGNVVGVSTPKPNAFKTLFYGIKASRGKTFGFNPHRLAT